MPRSKSPKQPRILPPPPERVAITLDQAPIEARLRYENAEKWIAWGPGCKSVIAADKDFEVVVEAARLAGFPNPRFEWVPPVTGAIWDSPLVESTETPSQSRQPMPRSKTPKQPRILPPPPERVAITLDQAPIEARLRYENAEKWIAWGPDEKSIVATGEDCIAVREAARLAGFPDAVCEWVPPVTGAIWE